MTPEDAWPQGPDIRLSALHNALEWAKHHQAYDPAKIIAVAQQFEAFLIGETK